MAVPRKRLSVAKLTRLYKISSKRLHFGTRVCLICYNKPSFSYLCDQCLMRNKWVYYQNLK